jgi:hypothetical protein
MQGPSTIQERLNRARQRRFVGREQEIDVFGALLTDSASPYRLLFIHGPGGVGKSSLLDMLARRAVDLGVPVLRFDARDVDPLPGAFEEAISEGLSAIAQQPLLERQSPGAIRQLVMIDTYELAEQLDGWLRDSFLPCLADDILIVLAGRNRPDPGWRSDPGWSALIRIMPLRNLRPDEVERFLVSRDIDEATIEDFLRLTHGHPLALSLLADLKSESSDVALTTLGDDPDLVGILLRRCVQDIPDEQHRETLAVCAHARLTTEGLLREAVSDADATALFTWLRSLSFIQEGPFGLYPHDLARDVLDADFRWRDLERYQQMHARVRAPIIRQLRATRGGEQQRAANDLLYLHRNGPLMGSFVEWSTLGQGHIEPLAEYELKAMLASVERFEGSRSASIAQFWYQRQPEAFSVFKDHRMTILGFEVCLSLTERDEVETQTDPAIAQAWHLVERHNPLRAGEVIRYFRYSLGIDGHQEVSQASNLSQIATIQTLFSNPHMAWSFMAMHESEHWRELMPYLNMPRSEDASFEIEGTRFDVFTHDWRAEPLDIWMEIMGEREIASQPPRDEESQSAPLLVLSRPDFDAAVKRAMRDLNRPDSLARNPLTRSRLVVDVTSGDSASALAQLLRNAADQLRKSPRDMKLYRAIHHTYVEPAATQELAAEALGLPFNTYRYHLSGGLRRISDTLWELELSR